MKEGFDINIKDNFLDEKLYESIYNKITSYAYSQDYNYTTETNLKNKTHLFYGTTVEKEISEHIRKKCEKLYNKKLKECYSAYTMVARTTPMVHCDKGEDTSHQIIIYIRGDESLHRGTGFYVEKDSGNYELNTHVGFKQNRAIFWESSVFHSPLIWSDENKSKRFSFLAQYKEIK